MKPESLQIAFRESFEFGSRYKKDAEGEFEVLLSNSSVEIRENPYLGKQYKSEEYFLAESIELEPVNKNYIVSEKLTSNSLRKTEWIEKNSTQPLTIKAPNAVLSAAKGEGLLPKSVKNYLEPVSWLPNSISYRPMEFKRFVWVETNKTLFIGNPSVESVDIESTKQALELFLGKTPTRLVVNGKDMTNG